MFPRASDSTAPPIYPSFWRIVGRASVTSKTSTVTCSSSPLSARAFNLASLHLSCVLCRILLVSFSFSYTTGQRQVFL